MSNRYTPAEQVAGATRFRLPEVAGPIVGDAGGPPPEPPRPPTADEIAEIRRSAYAAAFKQGVEQGYAEGLSRGQQAVSTAAAQLALVMEQLGEPLRDVDDSVVQAVSELALLIARHLVRRELRIDPGEVVGVVRETMRHLPVSPRLARIRLHPEDAELVQAAFALRDDERSWRLEPDPLITRGGCLVETDVSRVDATVETRLATIASRMLGGDRESDREE